MGRSGDGVEIRPKSIRLSFVDPDGVRRRETLTLNGVPMKPTAANVAYARLQADKLRRAIELGTFQLADFFPDSPRAEEATPDPRPTTFGPLADLWLDARESWPTPHLRSTAVPSRSGCNFSGLTHRSIN